MSEQPTRPTLRDVLADVVPNIVVIWAAIALYEWSAYYDRILLPEAKSVLVLLAATYSVLAIGARWASPSARPSHGRVLFSVVARAAKALWNKLRTRNLSSPALGEWSAQERTSVLFLIVKVHYLPMLVDASIRSFGSLLYRLSEVTDVSTALQSSVFIEHTFIGLMSMLFFVDALLYSCGYAFESKHLNNEIRSVDPTWSGWLVALACYDPLSAVTRLVTGWTPAHTPAFGSPTGTIVAMVVVLGLTVVFVWASLALGTRCSNLTNRGIVTNGPYAFVRHPAYTVKLMTWWLAMVPMMTPKLFLSLLVWTGLYLARALTEERHLLMDPEYEAYCERVRYRFFPGLI